MASPVATVALGGVVVWIIDLWIRYRKAIAQVDHLPGLRLLFAPSCILGNIIPRIRFISAGPGHGFQFKRTLIDQVGMDIYSGVGVFPITSAYFVSDPDALKQIFASRSAFKKHAYDYRLLTIFGKNLLSSEGDEWRRQRRIVAPVFSEKNNRLVQSSAKGFVDQMTDAWDYETPTHVQDVNSDMTMQLTLCVIAKAGFGQDIEWGNDGEAPDGHRLTFKQALLIVSQDLPLIIILPKWIFNWRKDWIKLRDAYEELRLYFQEMISSRRAANIPGSRIQAEEQHDLFNQLILAHDDTNTLSEEELVGNMFLFLFAGHETTAHSTAFTLGLLAIYPEEQRKVVEQIQELQQEGHEFVRGSCVNQSINIAGVHYNPNYWDDPTDFIPARFLDPNWDRDTFIPFLAGPRACIGRRFAETTAVTVLVRLLSKYTVTVDETMFNSIEGEPIRSRRERFLGAGTRTTLTPGKFPLVFTPRK
ncbi:hypothetical protein RSAG8_07075, partial [Rhizoctonia solani AG-8 WAC10335]